jgi:hypothetical protein
MQWQAYESKLHQGSGDLQSHNHNGSMPQAAGEEVQWHRPRFHAHSRLHTLATENTWVSAQISWTLKNMDHVYWTLQPTFALDSNICKWSQDCEIGESMCQRGILDVYLIPSMCMTSQCLLPPTLQIWVAYQEEEIKDILTRPRHRVRLLQRKQQQLSIERSDASSS